MRWRWPWSRAQPGGGQDPRAMAAARESREKLEEQRSRQPEVDRVTRMLRELGQRNHFAESVERALRARGQQ